MAVENKKRETIILIAAKLILFLILPIYLFVRIYFLVTYWLTTSWWLLSLLVFFAELYFIIHISNYPLSLIRSIKYYPRLIDSIVKYEVSRKPIVAIFIPVYNEPADIVEETVHAVKNIVYPNKKIYLLDDSDVPQNIEEIKNIAEKYNVCLMRRTKRIGFKGGCLNDAISKIECDYVVVFDADQQPEPNFLSELIPILEANSDIGYIQTPQLVRKVSEEDNNFIEKAASAGQHIFYHYICEGKATVNAQFSCGSNVIYRKKALETIKRKEGNRVVYFDEWSVTEDYGTSILLQEKGWKSFYYNKTYGKGIVPGSLEAFKAQRKRWAIGTLAVFWRYLPKILKFPLKQKWEYIISGTYFLFGIANFIMLVNIVLLLVFDIPIYTLLPFLLFTSSTLLFYYSQHIRKNSLKDLFYEQILNFIMFPLYIEALLIVFRGRKVEFSVTPKKNFTDFENKPNLLIQELTLLCCLPAFFIGINTFIATGAYYTLLNLFWISHAIVMLGVGIILIKRQYSLAIHLRKRELKLPNLFGENRYILNRYTTSNWSLYTARNLKLYSVESNFR